MVGVVGSPVWVGLKSMICDSRLGELDGSSMVDAKLRSSSVSFRLRCLGSSSIFPVSLKVKNLFVSVVSRWGNSR